MTSIHNLTLTNRMYKIACIYALFFLIIIPWDLKHHSFFLICYLHTFESWTLHLENCVLDLYNHIYPFHISFRLVFTVNSLDYLLMFYFLPGAKFSLSAHLLSWVIYVLLTSVPTSIFPPWSLFFGTFNRTPFTDLLFCLFHHLMSAFFLCVWKATKRTSGCKSCI